MIKNYFFSCLFWIAAISIPLGFVASQPIDVQNIRDKIPYNMFLDLVVSTKNFKGSGRCPKVIIAPHWG